MLYLSICYSIYTVAAGLVMPIIRAANCFKWISGAEFSRILG